MRSFAKEGYLQTKSAESRSCSTGRSAGTSFFGRDGRWGNRVIDRLAHDLQNEFPGIGGLGLRSLTYMRSFELFVFAASQPLTLALLM
jgi:hypothetical protein